MEKLASSDIDKALIDRNKKSGFRKIIQDKVVPATTVAAGAGVAAAKALANVRQGVKVIDIQ